MIVGSAKIFISRIFQVGLGALASILLARTLGVSVYGNYVLVLTILSTLIIPIQFGASRLIIRELANPALREGFLWWSQRLVLIWTAIATVALAGGIAALNNPPARDILPLLPITAVILISTSAMFFLSSILAGQKHTEKEQYYQNVVRPSGFILLLVLMILVLDHDAITAQVALAAYLLSVLLVVLGLSSALRGSIRLQRTSVPKEVRLQWLWSAFYFMAIGGIDAILQNADILMLGGITGSEDVAIYRVGSLLAGLLTLPLSAASTHAAPRIASADTPASLANMQAQCIQLARTSFYATLLLLAAALAFGQTGIRLAFGAGFGDSYAILVILGLASVFNAIMGLNRLVLTMTGHERITFRVMGFAAILNIALNAIFIEHYGALGAASATAASVFVWNILLHYECHRSLGFGVAVFSRPNLLSSS